MVRKSEQETKEKLQKLSKVIEHKPKPKNKTKKTGKSNFTTKEVVILVIATIIVSLLLGGIFTSKYINKTGEKVETELQEFINNYQYIVDNYNGEIDKEELLDAALNGMLQTLDDHSVFMSQTDTKTFNRNLMGYYSGVGIEVYNNKEGNIIINKVFKDSSAEEQGLKPGDMIIKYNNKDVTKTETNKLVNEIDKNNNKFKLTYLRDGKEYTVKLSKSKITLQSVTSKIYKQENKKIGYIRISVFASNTHKQFKQQFEELKDNNIDSLIIDLRNNTGGYLVAAESIVSLFLDSSHPIFQIQKQDKITKYYSKGKKSQTLKINILVNNASASASEVLASALQEQYKAKLIGEKTFGKGTVQELQELDNGEKYKLTTKNWLTSKGVWIDKKGIKPDIEVSLTEKYANDPTEENDNQLQTAIKELIK